MRPVTPASHPVLPSHAQPVRRTPHHPVRRRLTGLVMTLAVTVVLFGALLGAVAGPAAASGYIVLAPGDHGSRVVSLQRYLQVSPASGFYGPRTRQAVVAWQADHHRSQTGLVGRYLWSAVQGQSGRAPEPSRSGGRAAGLNWAALARCESGGNPGAVNPAGYYGLYQFSTGTWRSVGGSGLPSNASSGEQTNRAIILFGRTGAGSWPSCGHHLFD